MQKLTKLIKWDLLTQYKYGLFVAGIILSLVWISILLFAPQQAIPDIMPIVLLGDLATMGYLFIAAMVFFEKGQGSIHAVITTPITTKQYIQSKIISLLIFILGVSLIVVYTVTIVKGLTANLLFVLLSIIITAVFYMLLGLFISTKYKDFTDFLFPTGLWLMISFIPLLGLMDLPQLSFLKNIYYLFPTHGMVLLMKGIYSPISMYDTLYAIAINVVFIYLLAKLCLTGFNRQVIGRRSDIDG